MSVQPRPAEGCRAGDLRVRIAVDKDAAGAERLAQLRGERGERGRLDRIDAAVSAARGQRLADADLPDRPRRAGEMLVDAADGAVEVEVHGDDADARAQAGVQARAERVVRADVRDREKDGGMVGDDQVHPLLLRRGDRAEGEVEGEQRARDLRVRIHQEDAAVVVPAVAGDVIVAQALGIASVDALIYLA